MKFNRCVRATRRNAFSAGVQLGRKVGIYNWPELTDRRDQPAGRGASSDGMERVWLLGRHTRIHEAERTIIGHNFYADDLLHGAVGWVRKLGMRPPHRDHLPIAM